jgi:hypothetical protein
MLVSVQRDIAQMRELQATRITPRRPEVEQGGALQIVERETVVARQTVKFPVIQCFTQRREGRRVFGIAQRPADPVGI